MDCVDLRRSFCSLAARRGVDPVEAAQLTGHSVAVWATFYARSFRKAQRDEARDRLLEHGFGVVRDHSVTTERASERHEDERGTATRGGKGVERTGIEPVTFGLQSRRSPS